MSQREKILRAFFLSASWALASGCDAPLPPFDATVALDASDAAALDGADASATLDDVPNVPPGVPPPDASATLDGARD